MIAGPGRDRASPCPLTPTGRLPLYCPMLRFSSPAAVSGQATVAVVPSLSMFLGLGPVEERMIRDGAIKR